MVSICLVISINSQSELSEDDLNHVKASEHENKILNLIATCEIYISILDNTKILSRIFKTVARKQCHKNFEPWSYPNKNKTTRNVNNQFPDESMN